MKYKISTVIILFAIIFTGCKSQQNAAISKSEEQSPTLQNAPMEARKDIATLEAKDASELNPKTVELGIVQGLNEFMNSDTKSWFAPRYESYTPDAEAIESLKKLKGDITIRGYMGTWCGDSKRETPKLYRILSEIGYDMDKLTLIVVDRTKRKPEDLVDGYNIFRVPTFIFYRDGEEIGRFVERDRNMSLEQAMQKIWSGQEYKHAYE